jgi:uncharacterized phage-associated protein
MLFDIEKLIGFAAYIMKRLDTDSMKYIMLIKLMYLSDRKFVECYDSTISNDDFVSMPKGPVLSRLLNLIRNDSCEDFQKTWNAYFTTQNNDILMNENFAFEKINKLSRAEMKVIDGVVAEYGHWDRWELIDKVMHKLPEWENPNGSSRPISLQRLMAELGKSQEEIDAALEEKRLYEREQA